MRSPSEPEYIALRPSWTSCSSVSRQIGLDSAIARRRRPAAGQEDVRAAAHLRQQAGVALNGAAGERRDPEAVARVADRVARHAAPCRVDQSAGAA